MIPYWRAIPLLCAGVLLSGCVSSEPTYYHRVTALGPQAPLNSLTSALSVGIEPVTLPIQVDRQEIVLRSGPNTVEPSPTDAWIGPLDSMVTLSVAEDLAGYLNLDQVYILPIRRRIELERIVEIDIVQLDIGVDGLVRLESTWRLFDRRDELMRTGRIVVEETYTPGTSLADAVAAVNRSIARMTEEVAAAILGRPLQRTPPLPPLRTG